MNKKITMLITPLLVALMLTACAVGADEPPQSEVPVSSSEPSAISEPPPSSSSAPQSQSSTPESKPAEGSSEDSLPEPASSEPVQRPNPFAINIADNFDMYCFNADLFTYSHLGFSGHIAEYPSDSSIRKVIDAINSLPLLGANTPPTGDAQYGIMLVSSADYERRQFFLYENALVVDDTYYNITPAQHTALKQAMMYNPAMMGAPVPYWLTFMNPYRVNLSFCMDANGEMQNILPENILLAAIEAKQIAVSSMQTYSPADVDLSGVPFRAEYIFDSGIVHTVYVTDISQSSSNVKVYIQASSVEFGYVYNADSYSTASFVSSLREMINSPVNPRAGA